MTDLLFDIEEPEEAELNDWQVLKVYFMEERHRAELSMLLGQPFLAGTKSIWHPKATMDEGLTLPEFKDAGGWVQNSDSMQADLLDSNVDWRELWQGMPSYVSGDERPLDYIDVHFRDMKDRDAFARLLGYDGVSDRAPSLWFPKHDRIMIDEAWKSSDERNSPRYPVYVPTKGRWETALTIRWLERMGIPYYAVIQPQELDQYKSVVKEGEILTLPPECCVPGLGVVPARNWIKRHAISLGALRHWQFDDNINGFYRLHNNRKVNVLDGAIFRAMEDFSDRFTNVAISGPHYDFFAPRRSRFPPFILNTRVYSCSLIHNELAQDWRDVYNEDTDICLRALKEGLCTVQFYAFLQKKAQTMALKGGNTDILYKGDGRRKMAESLQRQHPDVVTIIERWGRVQHMVDYRGFRKNQLLRASEAIHEGPDEYGMQLVPKPILRPLKSSGGLALKAKPKVEEPPAPPVSIWDFLKAKTDSPSDPTAPPASLLESLPTMQAPMPTAVPTPSGETIVQFLKAMPPSPGNALGWVPDEPPVLDGIDNVVLNFATNGLNWAGGDRPVGLTVSTMDGQLSRFLPFAFNGGGNLDEATVKRFAKEQLKGKKITNANTRFDIHNSREWGVDLEEQGCIFSDIMHTAALLDDHRKRFALDILAKDYLPGHPNVARVDETRHADYHASDVAQREKFTASLVAKLVEVMYPQLDEQGLRRVQELEDSVIPAVVEMEKNGSPIDVELLDEFGDQCTKIHDMLMKEICDEVGFAFEHKESGWTRLLEHYGLPVPESFAESVLNQIDHPMVRSAQVAAQYASLNSKIFKPYKEKIGPDGILRFDVNQLRGDDGGTVSGRFSIGYVQQVPNHDNHHAAFGIEGIDTDACKQAMCNLFPRRLFVAGQGEYLESDAMQIEQRLFSHYANNKEIIDAYKKDPLISYHKVTWAMIKKYKPDMLYSHQKSFNFAKQYGARAIKLAIMMGFITEQEGNSIRARKAWNDPKLDLIHEIERAYKRMMPEGEFLLDYASHMAKPECDKYCNKSDLMHKRYPHRGYVMTLLGRRSRFPHANSKTYIGLNRVLQGTGADIMKQKLAELHKQRKETGFVLRLSVHDAVGGDSLTPETPQKVQAILNHQSFPELRVPILWSVNTGQNWAGCKG